VPLLADIQRMRCCSSKTAAPPGCFTQRATRPARLNPMRPFHRRLLYGVLALLFLSARHGVLE